MIGDKAFDSDPSDEQLKKLDIELIAPHKANRKKGKNARRQTPSVATNGDGKRNVCLRDCKTFVG